MSHSVLERMIQQLHEIYSEEKSSIEQRAHLLASHAADINGYCMQFSRTKDLAFCSSLLFHPNNGILAWLQQVAGRTELEHSKEALLKFLQAFIPKLGSRVQPYVVDLKTTCFVLFIKDKKARVRNATFGPLIEVFNSLTYFGDETRKQLAQELGIAALIDRFMDAFVGSASKYPATLKMHMMHALGLIAEMFPLQMTGKDGTLLSIYMSSLKQQMENTQNKKTELTIIAGALKGLTCFLKHFTQSFEDGFAGKSRAADIYKYTMMAMSPKTELNRLEVQRSALRLLAQHAGQYRKLLAEGYENVYTSIVTNCRHKNKDLQKAGFQALEAFLKELAGYIVETGKQDEGSKRMFKFFFTTFHSMIENTTSSSREVSIAIRGYGYLAGPCKLLMNEQQLRFMFHDMAQRAEQVNVNSEEEGDDAISHLSSYIDAIASIIHELEEANDVFLTVLEKLVIQLFEIFPRLHPGQRKSSFTAMSRCFLSLYPKGEVLKRFFGKIIYQGLLRVCSQPPITVLEGDDTENAHADYVELFENLLSDFHLKKQVSVADLPEENQQELFELLYDELIRALLRVIERLNFTTSAQGEGAADDATSDPVNHISATVPKDFQVFVTFVDFCQELLPRIWPSLFVRWVPLLCRKLMTLSSKYPLVSGFYKMLQITMSISRDQKYFVGVRDTTEDAGSVELAPGSVQHADAAKSVCFHFITKFVKEILVRIKQFKDELLSAALRFILSLPEQFVVRDVSAVLPAMVTSLKLGLGFPPLATAAVDTLEYWSQHIPAKHLEPQFKQLLPHVEAYMNVAHKQIGSTADEELDSMGKALQAARKKGSRVYEEVSPLEKVKIRLVKFLGSVGGTNASQLAVAPLADQKEQPSWMAWDRQQHLKYAVPFRDMKPTIYLDELLPRMTELSVKSSDRQIKVAACELLHSMVIFMIGQSAQAPGNRSSSREPLDALYVRVIPAVLQLACDVDLVAKQLFEPLVMQMIHWFTKSRAYENSESMALLNAVLDGLCHPSNSTLRDFCSRCVAEFFKWSIKQLSPEQLKKSPANVKSLLKRLFSLALHPNVFKRLGASLALNTIYRTFREFDALVDMFTMEMLYTYMVSLRFAHQDEAALGAEEQCSKAIQNLQRIVTKKATLFLKPSKIRRVPSDWEDATLAHLTSWTFDQIGRTETEVRHRAMMLFSAIAPCLQKISSPSAWIQQHMASDGPGSIVQLFEGTCSQRRPKDTRCGRCLAQVWFESVQTMLECYNWLFGQKLANPKTLWAEVPKFWSHIKHFVKFFALGQGAIVATDTSREVDQYLRMKCTVIVRLFEFMQICLGAQTLDLTHIFMPELLTLVTECLLRPEAVGFDPTDAEIARELPSITTQLLEAFKKRLLSKQLATFQEHLATELTKPELDLFARARDVSTPDVDTVALTSLVCGYEQLHVAEFLQDAMKGRQSNIESLSESIINALFDHSTTNNRAPTVVETAGRLMDLALALHVPRDRLLDCLRDQTPLDSQMELDDEMEDSQDNASRAKYVSQVHKGAAFNRDFGRQIAGYCLRHFTFLGPVLMKNAQHPVLGRVLSSVLEVARSDRTLRRYKPELMNGFLSAFKYLNAWWQGMEASVDTRVFVMGLAYKFLVIEHDLPKMYSHPSFGELFAMFIEFYSTPEIPLDRKGLALQALPYLTSVEAKARDELIEALETLKKCNFPVRSNEYAEGTSKRRDYVAALDHILQALVVSGSLDLLQLVITIFCREKEAHIHQAQMQVMLGKFIVGKNTKALAALTKCFKIFASNDLTSAFRANLCQRILCPCLRAAPMQIVCQFFIDHVQAITSIISERMRPQSSFDLPDQLLSKTCACTLMGVMYSRLPTSYVNAPGAKVNIAYCGAKKPADRGNDLTKAMCGPNGLRGALTETSLTTADDPTTELRRQYHCEAYNALAALITCTQTQEKFFTTFLFKENPAKAERLLDNLVDIHKDFAFEAELSKPIEVRSAQLKQLHAGLGQNRPIPGYMPSQFLVGSSLSQDVFGMDIDEELLFDAPANGEEDQPMEVDAAEAANDQPPALPMPVASDAQHLKGQEVYTIQEGDLEMDEFNRHECMGTILALLDKLIQIDPLPKVSDEPGATIRAAREDMPPWMRNLHNKMIAGETHPNVKLFIAKLVVNRPTVFQHWAAHWLQPLMQLILWFEKTNKGFNYFVTDLCVVLLTWSVTAIPHDREIRLAQRLLSFLMTSARHDNNAILKNNINIIKMFVEKWRTVLENDIPYFVIYSNFNSHETSSKWNLPGIHLLSVVLANDLPPFGADALANGLEEARYFDALISNLAFKPIAVYRAAAYVLGMALQALSTRGDIDTSIKELVNRRLASMVKPTPQQDRFLTCLHNICNIETGYPPLADPFLQTLLFWLPGLNGNFKTMALEIISWRCGTIDTLTELRLIGLLGLLSHRDTETQRVMLQTLLNLAPDMEWKHATYVMPTLCETFREHKETSCRTVFYNFLCVLFDRKARVDAGEEIDGGEDLEPLFLQIRAALLRGLMDEAASIRQSLFEFWDHETRLSKDTVDRLLATLSTLYHTSTEPYFLQYASNLLLRLTQLSVDFQRPLFEHPLSECTWHKYNIDSSWRQRNAHMTPLFASTQNSQASLSMMDDDEDFLMATQDGVQFTPTQTGGAFSMSSSSYGSSQTLSHTQQILLFRRKRRRIDSSQMDVSMASQSTPTPTPSRDMASQAMEAREIRFLRRRFIKTKDSRSMSQQYWAKMALAKRKRLEKSRQAQKKARENQIVMFRQYRTGELPDIEIKQRDLLEPLQALLLRDAPLAGLFYRSLFQAVYKEVDETLAARDAQAVRSTITHNLQRILSQTASAFAPFVGSIQTVCTSLSCVKVDSAAISQSSLSAHSLHSGILLLEEQLISRMEVEKPAKRARPSGRTNAANSEVLDSWIELSKLYKAVGEFDVANGIFSQKIGAKKMSLEALQLESRGDFKNASIMYDEAIAKPAEEWEDGTINAGEVDMWEDARTECLKRLCSWEDLEEKIIYMIDPMTEVDIEYIAIDQDNIWREPRFVEHHLGPLMHSQLRLFCDGVVKSNPHKDFGSALAEFVQRAMKIPERRSILESRFGPELATLFFALGDNDRARFYTAESLNRFLDDWSSLHPLMTEGRKALLQRLQPLVELHEFLGLLADDTSFQSLDVPRKMLDRWSQRYPASLSDPLPVWEDVVGGRMLILARLREECAKRWSDAADVQAAIARLDEMEHDGTFMEQLDRLLVLNQADMRLRFANEACKQEIFSAATKAIRRVGGMDLSALSPASKLTIEIRNQQAASRHRLSVVRGKPSDKAATALLKNLQKLHALDTAEADAFRKNPELHIAQCVLKAQTLQSLATVLANEDTAAMVSDTDLERLNGIVDTSDPHHIPSALCKLGLDLLDKESKQLSVPENDDLPEGWKKVESRSRPGQFSYLNTKNGKRQAAKPSSNATAVKTAKKKKDGDDEKRVDLLMSLATFCEHSLFGDLKAAASRVYEGESLARIFMNSILSAMREGSQAASQKYPRILQLLEDYPKLEVDFISQTARVPCWMFIGWISQMTALLDKPMAKAVYSVLRIVAKEYPNALRFPLMISSEDLKFGSDAAGKANKANLDKLRAGLKSDLTGRLLNALGHLSHPNLVFTDWCKSTMTVLLEAKKRDQAAIKAAFAEIKQDLFAGIGRDRSSRDGGLGSFRRSFADKVAKPFFALVGGSGEKLATLPAKAFRDGYRQLKVDEITKKLKEPQLLKEYSPWLDAFQGTNHPEKLEIPGQYSGQSKPLPEYHAIIENFDKKVLILKSMRKPKRLKFRGNDEREYPFLVKGGEDLRMDQRIQQLFQVMNQAMNNNPACSQRRLHLRTYQVVPMTTRIGIIEWMDGTMPLKVLLESAMDKAEHARYTDRNHGPGAAHTNWVYKFKPKQFPMGAYMAMIQKADRTTTVKEFHQKQGLIPAYLLRDALLSFSSTPEAFVTTRCHFGRTTGTIAICNYLVGIGDRHLSNFMVDTKTGGLVGIDFGHAFGSATQFLGIPELIPFRLTRQIVNVFQPHSEDGILKTTMIHVMQAMQNNADLLLSTMDVFVKEPLLDWQLYAQQEAKTRGLDASQMGDTTWYPQEKLEYARRKLTRGHPSHIMADELELGHKKKPAFKKMVEIVLGDKKYNCRAVGDRKQCSSVEEQISFLIDQATDPNILGRTWGGWEPWV